MKLRLSGQIAFSNAIIVVMLVAVAIGIGLVDLDARRTTSEAVEIASVTTTDIPVLIHNISDARYNVTLVQQGLSEISASRGKDGLDGGFDKAEQAVAVLKKDLEEARSVATRLGQSKIVTALDGVSAAFPSYYAQGKEMAQAYIDGGAEQGNRLRVKFDAEADKMTAALSAMVLETQAYSATSENHLSDKLDQLDKSISLVFYLTTIVTIAAVFVCGVIALVMHRRIGVPLTGMVDNLRKLSEGDFDVVVPQSDRSDEIGDLSRVLDVFRATGLQAKQLRNQQETDRITAEKNRRDALVAMAEKVESETGRVVETIAEQTGNLAVVANRMSGSADTVQTNANSVASASHQALATVEAVAGAGEELNSSLLEINTQIGHANRINAEAVAASNETEATITRLSDTVNGISEVVELISGIAAQTNLLALNATIEAARAGEAGKGFAVVAQEVKNLATQTGRSTDEITRQIGEIQAVTKTAVQAVSLIAEKIRDIDMISTAIAAAVEEQSAATSEIARNVTDSASASREVSGKIGEVSDEAAITGQLASEVGDLSNQVAHAVRDLRKVLVDVVRTSTSDVDRRHAPRVRVAIKSKLRVGRETFDAEIENLSEGGAMVKLARPVSYGTLVDLDVPAAKGWVSGRVCAVNEDEISIEFNTDENTQVALKRFVDHSL
ncbi:methyl-accepting chemotaxis protein [Thalassospira mesophila]|uniref:methyl-accepting chemotaxis protein n=1 Tax=Thalassospira mesophila TaxID=1293891 RepID=UPI000A1DDDEC|nr:methyl-accepting chemotaxis protein [Thalassospira mesophila]